LFHFRPEKGRAEDYDRLTPGLVIDDKVLKEIIGNLYYPDSPYEFSILPADILGQVYEQFLGKVIRLTAGHQAKVEDKPEVKKAGGVFYTPTYIVEYIVRNTVDKLLEGKTPKEAAKLAILDPACGSGSFLIGAFQRLLDWHRDWYVDNGKEKWAKGNAPALYQGPGGEWRLTTSKRKEILLNNIYGVDIDPQAVEVTKLSLLLKVLEGESDQTLTSQFFLFHKRALPDLGNNIKCGNSLIGPDFYQNRQLSFMDEEERLRINVFDWEKEFPQIFRGPTPGFDAVVGNPPYIRIQALKEWAPLEVDFYKKRYISASKGNYDIYVVFVEKGLHLLSKRGRLGYILPSKFFSTDYGEGLRRLITEKQSVAEVIDFGHAQVFRSATTYTNLLFLSGSPIESVNYGKILEPPLLATNRVVYRTIESKTFTEKPWYFGTDAENTLVEKIFQTSMRLADLPARIGRGTSSGNDDTFILQKKNKKLTTRHGDTVDIEEDILRTPIYATDFGRYLFAPTSEEVIIFPYDISGGGYELRSEANMKGNFPKAYIYLLSRRKELEKRKQFSAWYGFSAPRNLEVHAKAQILVPLLADRGMYCRLPEKAQKYCLMASGGFSITVDSSSELSPNYVLALLNSKLLFWRLRSISNKFRGGWITCTKQYVETLPIYNIDVTDPIEKDRHDKIVLLVDKMLSLNKRLPELKTDHEKTAIQRQIDATDQQIDQLVYELYGLTDEEIRIVEEARP